MCKIRIPFGKIILLTVVVLLGYSLSLIGEHLPNVVASSDDSSSDDDCDPSYPDVCIAPAPPDLNCGDIPYKDIKVEGSDPHQLDREGDGVACES